MPMACPRRGANRNGIFIGPPGIGYGRRTSGKKSALPNLSLPKSRMMDWPSAERMNSAKRLASLTFSQGNFAGATTITE